ncbi:hypothetical protein ACQ4LE_001330 [Meloidogyne hapla]
MSSNQFNPKNLFLKSTASIIENIGFSTTNTTPLNILNNLLIIYFEQLCNKWKLLVEESNSDNEELDLALLAFQQNSYFGWNEFKDFLESTISSVSNVEPLPYFPVKLPEEDYNTSKIVLNDTTHADITVAQTNNDLFPKYSGLTAKDLQMENLLADSRYVSRKSFRDSLDSLSSPVLAFCNPVRLQPTLKKRKTTISKASTSQQQNKSESDQSNEEGTSIQNNQINYKAVHSVKGLKMRLLKNMENTPPGFFSARMKEKKNY